MKEFIEFVKQLWKNKKTRSLAILILYGIFFIFVFTLLSNSSVKPNIDSNPYDYLKTKVIYKMEFSGPFIFVYENNQIYYNGVIYNEVPVELLGYDFSMLNVNNIYNLLNKSVLESKNYIEKSSTYVISAKDFENIVFNNVVDINSNIRIKIYEENLNEIIIDLNEYYGYSVKIYLRS